MLNSIEVTRDEVLELIGILKDSNSLTPDGIDLRVLEELKYEIADLLLKSM